MELGRNQGGISIAHTNAIPGARVPLPTGLIHSFVLFLITASPKSNGGKVNSLQLFLPSVISRGCWAFG